MIEGQSKLIDTFVFDEPKSRLEQMRNLQLTTGGMNVSPKQYIKPATDAIDMMLSRHDKCKKNIKKTPANAGVLFYNF